MITHQRFARFNGRSGMTLVELCVVIAILGVLFVLAVATVKRARLVANESSAIGALRTGSDPSAPVAPWSSADAPPVLT